MTTSALAAARRERALERLGHVGHDAHVERRRSRAASACRRSCSGCCRRSRRRASGCADRLAARRRSRRTRRAACGRRAISPMPSDASMPSSAGSHALAGAEHDCAAPSGPRRRSAGSVPPWRRRPARRARRPPSSRGALLHHDGVGALRHHAAGEDAHASRRRRRAPPNGLPANDSPTRVERRLAVRRRDRRSAPPSRPSPSCRGPARRAARRCRAASTRPSAARTCTRSMAVTGARNWRISCARRVDRHRVRIVVVGAGELAQRLRRVHGAASSRCSVGARHRRALRRSRRAPSAVLMLRNASASSSNAHLDDAQRRVPRVDLAAAACEECASRCGSTSRRTSANTGCGWSNGARDRELGAVARRARRARRATRSAAGTANRRARSRRSGVVARGQARVQAGERTGESADRVGDDRIAERRVALGDSGWR